MLNCFVIMSFDKEFDDVYDCIKESIKTSIPGKEVNCFRLDEIKTAGKISDDLLKSIQESVICIADLTSNNPNVMWEVGYAMALKKPLVTISQDIKNLPFDLKDWRTIKYCRDSLSKTLKPILPKAFKDTLGTYEVRRDSKSVHLPKSLIQTIAVTGSMDCLPEKCKRRIETTLLPYLKRNISWLCGSFGTADECVINFLANHKERVFVVGYNEYDLSPNVLEMLERYNLQFIDAQKEQLPKGIDSPTERDLLFLTKAELFIVFWNGRSSGTEKLLKWYSLQNQDHIISFI
ncbi:MAG: hypothetical protein GF353_16195 [Candidatus Lokiarchaeota archaeon]|nr:hypothetical protein [Candidatus Lokiarchaeota archaeon]